MALNQFAIMNFKDTVSDDDAYVGVRTYGDHVGVTLSLSHDGDAEVFLNAGQCQELIAALQAALACLGGEKQ